MTDCIIWWTGAIVWALIGGSLIMTLVSIAAMIIAFITYRMTQNAVHDIAAITNRTRKVKP